MLSILQELAENHELACIYRADAVADIFHVGRVAATDEDLTLFYSVTPDGRYGGYFLLETDTIIRVDTSNRYLEKIKRLLAQDMPPVMDIPDDYEDLARVMLDFAVKNRAFVSLRLGDSENYGVEGFVLEVQEEVCRMLLVDEYGYPDGISTFAIDEITCGECDSRSGQITRKLYDDLVKGKS